MTSIPVSLIYRFVTFQWDYKIEILGHKIQSRLKGDVKDVDYSEINSKPELIKGFFWSDIVFNSSIKPQYKISGIKKSEAQSIYISILNGIKESFRQELCPLYKKITDSYQTFENSLRGGYVKYRTIEHWKEDNSNLYEKLNNEFALESIPDDERTKITNFLSLFFQAHDIRENKNQKFISQELKNYSDYFDTVENNPLTESQRLACVVNEGNNLVLAGAGSGKTSVIIAKTGYLIKSGLAKPHEILILAYGRKASRETNERIKEKLPQIEGVKTSTFHKLGLDIIGAVTQKKPRVSRLQEDASEFDLLINRIISELTQKDPAYNQRIIDYFITHLVPHKSEFDYTEQGEYFAALKEGDVRSLKSRIQWAEKELRGPL